MLYKLYRFNDEVLFTNNRFSYVYKCFVGSQSSKIEAKWLERLFKNHCSKCGFVYFTYYVNYNEDIYEVSSKSLKTTSLKTTKSMRFCIQFKLLHFASQQSFPQQFVHIHISTSVAFPKQKLIHVKTKTKLIQTNTPAPFCSRQYIVSRTFATYCVFQLCESDFCVSPRIHG